MTPADIEALLKAAEIADWQQVVLNGGPPCFHLERGRFCLRAKPWAGHPDRPDPEIYPSHKYVSLSDLLAQLVREQAGEIERLKGIVNDFVKWFSPSCEKDLKVILNEARAFPYLAPPAAKEPS